MSLLSVQGLTIGFAGQTVVRDASFSLAAGEKRALVGESGSGKTVTALSLLGLAQGAQVSGRAMFGGEAGQSVDLLALSDREQMAVRGRDIAMVFQEPMTALNPVLTIGEQIAEVLQLKTGLTRAQAWTAAIALLADTGIAEPQRRVKAFAHQLSGGQRQRAMIAMAIACKPRLLLADEPTTALDPTVRKQILGLLSDLQRQHGMAVLLITHDLNLVRRFADRVAVMERGCIVEQGSVEEVFTHARHPYTQRLMDSRPLRDVVCPTGAAATAVQAHDLQVAYPVPRRGLAGWFFNGQFVAVGGVDFQVPAGETLGIIGESGSGKSTLALALLALLPFKGQIHIHGNEWNTSLAADLALRKQIQVVFQDPFSSLSPRLTVEEIVGEGLLVHAPSLSAAERLQKVTAALGTVGLTEAQFPGLLQRYVHQFSGGQRQRIAIARALIVDPQILVLDEPTSALDVTMAQQILQLLQGLQKKFGLTYLLITHDVSVVRAMAHAVLVLKEGKIVESGPIEQVFLHPSAPYTRALLAAGE